MVAESDAHAGALGLAVKLGITGQELENTIARYNRHCRNEDTDFGRPPASLVPLEKEPFYAVKVYPATLTRREVPSEMPDAASSIRMIDRFLDFTARAKWDPSGAGWMYNAGGNNAEALSTGRIAGRNGAAEKRWP